MDRFLPLDGGGEEGVKERRIGPKGKKRADHRMRIS